MVDVSDLVGTKFVNQGRKSETGLDCWGLVMEVFDRCGVQIPDFTIDAFKYSAIDKLATHAVRLDEWENVPNPTEEDAPLVVLMRMHPNFITHAGVYIGHNRILHTMENTNAILSHIDILRNIIVGYYRPC